MNIRSIADKFRKIVRRHGLGAGMQFVGLAALRRQVCLERVHLFELVHEPESSTGAANRSTRLATAADLVTMTKQPVWDLMDLNAHDVDALLGAGHRCVLNVVDDQIAGYAWMNPHRIIVPKLRLAIPLDPSMVHVYRGLTHPSFRGQRIGCDRFAHWYRHLTVPQGIRVLADFAFDNPATSTLR